MNLGRGRVQMVYLWLALASLSLGLLSCGDSVTAIRNRQVTPDASGSQGRPTLSDLLASVGVYDPAVGAQAPNECVRLALEADRAAKAYAMAVHDLARLARKSPDSQEAAAARQLAIDAFDGLRTSHQAMADACRPIVVDGTYDITPALALSCPFIPLGFGEVGVREVSLTMTSPTTVLVSVSPQLGLIPNPGTIQFTAPYNSATRTFGGTGDIAFSNANVTASGVLTLNGTFVGPDTFEGNVTMSLHLIVSYAGFSFSGQCSDLSAGFTATRQ